MKVARTYYYFTLLILPLFVAGCGKRGNESGNSTGSGQVEKLDAELDSVIDEQAVPEVLGEGFSWTEGPAWVPQHDFLLFSDIPSNRIYWWKEGEGVNLYLEPAGYTGEEKRGGEKGSNGLLVDRRGHLLLCQHGDRRVARMEAPLSDPEPNFTTLAGSYRGRKFNSPNDLVQHSNGDLFFTDPPYGLEEGVKDPKKELDFQGVFRLRPSGDLELLTDELSRPNGIALSPDEKTLYVANSDPDRAVWMAYDLDRGTDDGQLQGRVFHDSGDPDGREPGLPDGMAVDSSGYIYATGPGGVWIFAPDGRVLGKIRTGQLTSNCTIGNGGTMLYMTADNYLMRIPLK